MQGRCPVQKYPGTLNAIKIHVRRAADREYSYFHLYMCVCFSLFVYLFMCVTPPGQTKNDKDTHSPRPHLRTFFFCFFKKVTLRAANLENLPCLADFPHISSIALSRVFVCFHFCNVVLYIEKGNSLSVGTGFLVELVSS